ncbi:hypothetical protein APHAL10511_002127 [Amanita phalloides]|nr:hypothetical protein APHAL10511_002127 [Amanita phalloides]
MPSVAEFNSSDFISSSIARQKKYYNRPKFLQAPDPDSLATPSFGILGEVDQIQSPPLLDFPDLPIAFEGLVPPDSFFPTYQDDFSAAAHPKHLLSVSQTHSIDASVFPPPPTLEDIQRMEPNLSPESIMKRVGTIGDHLNDLHSHAALFPTAQTKSSVIRSVIDGYSPIARPMKRCRTNSIGQGLFAQDLIDGIKREVRFTHKRLRVEADGLVWHARWYTDYLITALSRTQFRGKFSTSAAVYDKLWRRITGLLWDFGLSESVVLLAFWYIDRLFPDGFMHSGMFASSEGGTIAWRIFLLCNMLAEKWLDDTTHPFATWQPYFELSSKSVKALERTVLRTLDYNIYISNVEWQRWIKHLQSYCRAEGYSNHLQCTVMELLYGLMDDAFALSTEHDKARLLYTPEGNSCQLVLDLLEPYGLEDRLELTTAPLLLRTQSHSTDWNPAADPILLTRPRSFGIAPIARPTNRSVHHLVHAHLLSSRNAFSNVFAEPGIITDGFSMPIMT